MRDLPRYRETFPFCNLQKWNKTVRNKSPFFAVRITIHTKSIYDVKLAFLLIYVNQNVKMSKCQNVNHIKHSEKFRKRKSSMEMLCNTHFATQVVIDWCDWSQNISEFQSFSTLKYDGSYIISDMLVRNYFTIEACFEKSSHGFFRIFRIFIIFRCAVSEHCKKKMSKTFRLVYGGIRIKKKRSTKESFRLINSNVEIYLSNDDVLTAEVRDKNKKRTNTQSESKGDAPTCKICLDHPVNLVYIPCGHAVTCNECHELMHRNLCTFCNQEIENKMKIFFWEYNDFLASPSITIISLSIKMFKIFIIFQFFVSKFVRE